MKNKKTMLSKTEMNTDYKKGRADLIEEIKAEVSHILDRTDNPNDLMFDMLSLLRSLK